MLTTPEPQCHEATSQTSTCRICHRSSSAPWQHQSQGVGCIFAEIIYFWICSLNNRYLAMFNILTCLSTVICIHCYAFNSHMSNVRPHSTAYLWVSITFHKLVCVQGIPLLNVLAIYSSRNLAFWLTKHICTVKYIWV